MGQKVRVAASLSIWEANSYIVGIAGSNQQLLSLELESRDVREGRFWRSLLLLGKLRPRKMIGSDQGDTQLATKQGLPSLTSTLRCALMDFISLHLTSF